MDEFMGVIKIFGGNFPPSGWAFCNGQLMSIAQYSALFSILGTTYGGDGQTTFALPDLRSRVPVGMGQGPGLPSIEEGEQSGEVNHTLLLTEIPMHTHSKSVNSANASLSAATAGSSLATPVSAAGAPTLGFNTSTPDTTLSAASIGISGGSQPHNNMQPYLGTNYIICLEGIYPSRN